MVQDRLEGKEVEFVHEWMGNPPGSRKKLYKWVADDLIYRGTAKDVEVDRDLRGGKAEPVDEVNRLEGVKGEDELGAQKIKSLRQPPKDKMVKAPSKSK